jgi:hypothetical protein
LDQSPVIHDPAFFRQFNHDGNTRRSAFRRARCTLDVPTGELVHGGGQRSGRRVHSLGNAKRRKTGVGTVQPLTDWIAIETRA